MKNIIKCVVATITLSAMGTAFAASGKSVVIMNNEGKPVTITYSVCDGKGTLCEFTKTARVEAGGKLVIK